eukprot:CAMPEP_0197031610 /NCGR_PEP_ID=MMETSP1384-20130603/10575_1 /TAXON_ID=29189 /ORGANISM="Ammonia sp." /LENGTH=365 /DNA_ID=CAMNT_0042461167 /DNA_START=24 /DNA_END=1121 /DNA_ORIENTATION=-
MPSKMEYRLLGTTGLKVSVLGMGAMTYDTVEKTMEFLKCVRKYGVNFFDNAEAYGNPRGLAETNFGAALKRLQKEDPKTWRRSDLVITTKIFFGPQAGNLALSPDRSKVGVNELGLTRKHLMEGIRDSLQRMQLEYVDIVYAHRPDSVTSTEEIVRSFHNIIERGLAFHWGCSMWTPTQIVEAHWIAKLYNLHPPVVEQPIYSMFNRDVVEREYLPVFRAPYNMGTTIWNVLDRGILSGKYNKEIPKDGRLSGNNPLGSFVGHSNYVTKDKLDRVQQLMQIANELNISVAELAIAWVIKNRNVTVCLLGATKTYQLEQAMGAIAAANKLNATYIARIEEILNNKPAPGMLDIVWRGPEKEIISKL